MTQPFDLAKTRLQLQNTTASAAGVKKPTRGIWKTLVGVVREEGFWELFSGVGPAALRQVIYGGICTGFYKPLKNLMYPGVKNEDLDFFKRLSVSLITGISGQTCALPLDLIKVRMQADGRLKLMGQKPRYTSATNAFFTIIREEGYQAFFTGVSPTLIRAGLLTVGGIACYDSSKEWIRRHFHTSDDTTAGRLINCTGASIYSGFVSTCMSNPFDVVKTRMMLSASERGQQKLSVMQMFSKVYRVGTRIVDHVQEEGFRALFSGAVTRVVLVSTAGAVYFGAFEAYRKRMREAWMEDM